MYYDDETEWQEKKRKAERKAFNSEALYQIKQAEALDNILIKLDMILDKLDRICDTVEYNRDHLTEIAIIINDSKKEINNFIQESKK